MRAASAAARLWNSARADFLEEIDQPAAELIRRRGDVDRAALDPDMLAVTRLVDAANAIRPVEDRYRLAVGEHRARRQRGDALVEPAAILFDERHRALRRGAARQHQLHRFRLRVDA